MSNDFAEQERSPVSALMGFEDLDQKIAHALGARHDAFMAYREDWKRGAVPRPFPLQLDFALNEACNLKCPMCTWSEDKVPTRRLFSLAHYSAILAECVPQGLKAVGLNGVNEPLMRRDLPEFVRAASNHGVLDIMCHTNGTLLTEKMAEGLIDAGLTRLMVSLDAVTPETYAKMRVGARLSLVERNIHEFLALRGSATLPVLGVCFVRTSLNAHEERDFIQRWKGVADFFSIQSYMHPFVGDRPDKTVLAADGWRPGKPFVCPQPFQRMRIQVGGEVSPCCSFYGDMIPIGYVTEGIKQLWTKGDMPYLRRLHTQGPMWHDDPDEERKLAGAVCRSCIRHSFTEVVSP